MMACGDTVGDESWSGEAKDCILKRKHHISHSIPCIHQTNSFQHRTRVIFAKLNFTNDESTQQLALKFKNLWSGESLSLLISFNKSYSDIPLSTGPATIKSSGLFGRRLKSVNHDIRRPFRSKTRTRVTFRTHSGTLLERVLNVFRTRTQC